MFAWSLYDIENEEDLSAQYLLRTRSARFLLRKDGNIIRKMTLTERVVIKSQVFFEGFVLQSDSVKMLER